MYKATKHKMTQWCHLYNRHKDTLMLNHWYSFQCHKIPTGNKLNLNFGVKWEKIYNQNFSIEWTFFSLGKGVLFCYIFYCNIYLHDGIFTHKFYSNMKWKKGKMHLIIVLFSVIKLNDLHWASLVLWKLHSKLCTMW